MSSLNSKDLAEIKVALLETHQQNRGEVAILLWEAARAIENARLALEIRDNGGVLHMAILPFVRKADRDPLHRVRAEEHGDE